MADVDLNALTLPEVEEKRMVARPRYPVHDNIHAFPSSAPQELLHNTLSPFQSTCYSRRVPVEIWATIFTLVIGNTSSFVAYNHHRGTPWSGVAQSNTHKLTLVCSHWRDIILQLPCLWTLIEVNLRDLEKDVRSGLQLHLDRSKDRPLRLVIDYRARRLPHQGHDYPDWTKNISIVLDYMVRLLLPRCIELGVYMDGFEDYFLSSLCPPYPCISFPSLVTFDHDFDPSPSLASRFARHWLWDALRDRAPLLRRLTNSEGILPTSYIHYAQLTELHMHTHVASPNLIYTLLSCSQSLEVLSITDTGSQRSQFLDMQSNASLSARVLNVDIFSSPTTILDVLSFFTFPHLTTLRVTAGFPFCCFESSEDWVNLLERIKRCSQTIQHLELHLVVSDQPHIHREALCLERERDGQHCLSGLLRAVPNLTELVITVEGEGDSYASFFEWLLSSLAIPRTLPASLDDILLPRLCSLSILDDILLEGNPAVGKHIAEMVLSRSALSWWPSLVGEGRPVALLERIALLGTELSADLTRPEALKRVLGVLSGTSRVPAVHR